MIQHGRCACGVDVECANGRLEDLGIPADQGIKRCIYCHGRPGDWTIMCSTCLGYPQLPAGTLYIYYNRTDNLGHRRYAVITYNNPAGTGQPFGVPSRGLPAPQAVAEWREQERAATLLQPRNRPVAPATDDRFFNVPAEFLERNRQPNFIRRGRAVANPEAPLKNEDGALVCRCNVCG